MSRSPLVLVVGPPHSGTTILDAALGVSPHVVGVGEALRLTAGANPGHLDGGASERICTCGTRAGDCPLWSGVLPHLGSGVSVASHFPLVAAAARGLSPEVRLVLDSSPNALDYLDALEAFDVRVLQITRDVRSWVASRRRRKGDNLVSAHVTWLRNVVGIDSALTDSGLPRFRLGYEELALRPREVLGMICDWLGVPFDERMLTPFGNTGSHIITGNSSIRTRRLAASIRYDGSWMVSDDYPLASAVLSALCMRTNRRLVYSNDLLKRRT
ncbi:sulfotransferase [Mameliella sp. AT18]|uniref:sulfotransferase family protein n=1 Tax=Mameliella sp. AT18 TaxID=3028385 RepID=UPI000841208A|nr:sulfotransferase [Mameliella sp. AT18]MDD9732939.1 sulfotransferase [Mameliella sp. AT18]ODM48355.1 hypothetical protein A9320_19075 [Ruegeria sp. PBVC088]